MPPSWKCKILYSGLMRRFPQIPTYSSCAQRFLAFLVSVLPLWKTLYCVSFRSLPDLQPFSWSAVISLFLPFLLSYLVFLSQSFILSCWFVLVRPFVASRLCSFVSVFIFGFWSDNPALADCNHDVFSLLFILPLLPFLFFLHHLLFFLYLLLVFFPPSSPHRIRNRGSGCLQPRFGRTPKVGSPVVSALAGKIGIFISHFKPTLNWNSFHFQFQSWMSTENSLGKHESVGQSYSSCIS